MTTEQKIICYLGKVSKGQVNLTTHHAIKIIELVLNAQQCRVMLYRYNYQQKSWELMLTINTDIETINQAILNSLKNKPVDNFYRYDLYNEMNELQGYIYSVNPSLF